MIGKQDSSRLYTNQAGIAKIAMIFNQFMAKPADGELEFFSFQYDSIILHICLKYSI